MDTNCNSGSCQQPSGSGCGRGCLIALAVLAILTVSPVLVAIGISVIAIVFGLGVTLFSIPLASFATSEATMPAAYAALVLFLLSIVIPLVVLVIWLARRRDGQTLSGKGWAMALILWILSILGSLGFGAYAVWQLPLSGEGDWDDRLEEYMDTLEQKLDSLTAEPSEGVLEITEEDLSNV